MRILFSSASGSDKGEAIHYRRVLRRLGHDVVWVTAPSRETDHKRGLFAEPGFAPDTPLDALLSVIGAKPDLYLYVEPLGLIPRGLESAPFPTACVLCDVHRNLAARRRQARFFDHVFLYHCNYLKSFDEHPHDNVHWMPYGCDIEVFRPNGATRDLDVAFVGQLGNSRQRQRVLPALARRWRINEQRYYLQREIPEVYSRAKIVINMPLGDDLNFRVFEAMSCGALLLTSRIRNGQERLFTEGQHFVAFGDEAELFEKIDYYLQHVEEREVIAATGLAAIQENHRLDQRLTDLLNAVRAKPERVAPIAGMSMDRIEREYTELYRFWGSLDAAAARVGAARQAGRRWGGLLVLLLLSLIRRVRARW
jgi:hypothetical protein